MELIKNLFNLFFPPTKVKPIITYDVKTKWVVFESVGTFYRKEEYKKIEEGDKVIFFQEPNNPHDKNAIALRRKSDGIHFGYVNRSSTEKLNSYLTAGHKYDATVKEKSKSFKIGCKIHVDLLWCYTSTGMKRTVDNQAREHYFYNGMNIKLFKTVPDNVSEMIREILMKAYDYPEDIRRKEIDEIHFNVEREDGDLYVAYDKKDNEPNAFCVCQTVGGVTWLYWIGVLEGQRGQGIATEFLEHILHILKVSKNHKVWADSVQSNTVIYKVFKKMGFTVFAAVNNFWHNQDYFLWSKDI